MLDQDLNSDVDCKIMCQLIHLTANLLDEQLYDFQVIKNLFLVSIKLFQEINHSFDGEGASFVVRSVVFNLLLLKVALLNIKVQKFDYVLDKQDRVYFIDLAGLS
jgi:hypothetical protein